MVCGRVFLRPAIARMLGLAHGLDVPLPARLGAAIEANGPRAHYMRARVEADAGAWVCTPFARQDSSLVSVLAEANALMVRAPGDPARGAGEMIGFIWL
jgi:molybdopterin molybdotransferase